MNEDDLQMGDCFLQLLESDFILNHLNVWTSNVIVLVITALALIFVVPLMFVQLGNLCLNKSTNERFSYAAIRAA